MRVRRLVGIAVVLGALLWGAVGSAAELTTEEARERFFAYLRAHFEDIHEVSMRFHMTDPSLGGHVVVHMVWVDGSLESATVGLNETGNDDEGAALVEAMKAWHIDDMPGRHEFDCTFRIRLVGSDDPSFAEKAMVTGSVRDAGGNPLGGARIRLVPHDGYGDPIEARCNREGIFVRTLIPPGVWDLTATHPDHEAATITGIELQAGQHRIEHVALAGAQDPAGQD